MNATDAVAAESTIKYHLVEAEEVGHKSQPSATRNPKPKRKSKFNWSQVPVEGDEMVTPESEESVGSGTNKEDVRADVRMRVGQYDQQHSRGGWYPRNGGRSGGRRQYRDSHGSFYNGVYVPTPDVTVTAQWAKNQIEFYFTCDNLAVYSVHQDYESLFEAMKHSKTIQLDEQNEKIRLRTDWQKWVWPNTNGGYGVPRYVKHKTDEAAAA
uniref:Uncharacterized protein n=1 Tax=Hyaloperonospora arabidopsidis (strain Emoy2) TaxID=559515 RepID=M4BJ42_HYAAE